MTKLKALAETTASTSTSSCGRHKLRLDKNGIFSLSWNHFYMGVSKNRGTPKSSILIGFSTINHPFWGTTIFRITFIFLLRSCRGPNGSFFGTRVQNHARNIPLRNLHSLKLTFLPLQKRPSPKKERIAFQPSICQGLLL